MRNSKQRNAILDTLKNCCDHPTADTVYERVKTIIPDISLGTVYRDLKQLSDEGQITVVESSDAKVRYEGNLNAHIHFICKRCGELYDVFCEPPVPRELTEKGFKILCQKTVYYGICSKCVNYYDKNNNINKEC